MTKITITDKRNCIPPEPYSIHALNVFDSDNRTNKIIYQLDYSALLSSYEGSLFILTREGEGIRAVFFNLHGHADRNLYGYSCSELGKIRATPVNVEIVIKD